MWDMHLPARTHSSIYTRVLSQILSVPFQEGLHKHQADYSRSFGLRVEDEKEKKRYLGITGPSTRWTAEERRGEMD